MSDAVVAAILGLIEGLTEFLPVSSTGHLLLAERFLPKHSDVFNVVIQSGAVLAVLVAFAAQLKDMVATRKSKATQIFVAKLAVSFLLTAAGGLVLKKLHVKLPETAGPVAWATLVGGVLFIVVEMALARRTPVAQGALAADLSWPAAIAMGLGQLVAAVFPGASRSGTTILFGLMLNQSRASSTAYSFLLGVPTLLAAGCVEVLGAIKDHEPFEPVAQLVWASAVAAVTAFVVVRWLIAFVRSHSFVGFGVYRIVLGAAMLGLGP